MKSDDDKTTEPGPIIKNGFEFRNHEKTAPISVFGRSYTYIVCPFCGREVKAYIWSLSGSGKKCICGAIHGGWGLSRKKVAE